MRGGQLAGESHLRPAPPHSSEANRGAEPTTYPPRESEGGAIGASKPKTQPPRPADAFLTLAADQLSDIEALRMASERRYASLTNEDWGKGIPKDNPAALLLASQIEQLKAFEHGADLALRRIFRKHPLGSWVKDIKGVGERQAARLIAATGDLTWHALYDRPRTIGEVWSNGGLKPGQVRRKGQKCNWNPEVKSRAFVIITRSLIVARRKRGVSPYADVYYGYKEKHQHKVDEGLITKKHLDNRARRYAAKRLLKHMQQEWKRVVREQGC